MLQLGSIFVRHEAVILSFTRHFFVNVKFQWRIGKRCLLRSRFFGRHVTLLALRDNPKNGSEGD